MRKSGLHKQISSIFDGVPIPGGSAESQPDGPSLDPLRTPAEQAADAGIKPAGEPVKVNSAPSLAKRLSADPSECPQSPAIAVMRPAPLPKKKPAAAHSAPNISTQLRKSMFGGSGKITPQQKKMTTLVGILSVVFAAVLFVSLGGMGKSKAVAADRKDKDKPAETGSVPKVSPETWAFPEPIEAEVRDATKPLPKTDSAGANPQNAAAGAATDLVIRGIVFSKNRPSAIINNKVCTVGETINGVTIAQITHDAVTFETDGKSWTQQVQR